MISCSTSSNNCTRCDKDLKDNKDNSLHLGSKYARIFVLGHYLFLMAHSFPWASLSENCMLFGTDNVRRQISVHIFVSNGGYCLYNPQKLVVYFLKKQFNGGLWELFQFLVCTAKLNEVLAMNIINKICWKFGNAHGQIEYLQKCLLVFAPENQLLIAEFGL